MMNETGDRQSRPRDLSGEASKRVFRILVIIFVAAVGIRVALILPLHAAGYGSDEREYAFIAHKVLDEGRFIDSNGERATRAPLYPIALAGVFAVFGNGLYVPLILGCVLGGGVVLGVFALSRQLGNSTGSAFLGACAATVAPGLVICSTLLQTEMLSIAFFVAALVFGYRLMDGGGFADALLSGGCLGLAALTRAEFLPFIPILLLTFFLARQGMRERLVRGLLLALTASALVIAPWVARNFLVLHAVVPVSSISGGLFLMGHNPYSHGSRKLGQGYDEWVSDKAAALGVSDFHALNEVEAGRVETRIALDYMLSHPVDELRLVVQKAYVYWIYPATNSDSNIALQAVAVASDALLLLGVAVGFVVTLSDRRRLLPLYSAVVFFTIVHLVLHAEARYRVPLIPLLCVFFGSGLWVFLDHGRVRELLAGPMARWAAILCGAVVFIYGLTGWLFLKGLV